MGTGIKRLSRTTLDPEQMQREVQQSMRSAAQSQSRCGRYPSSTRRQPWCRRGAMERHRNANAYVRAPGVSRSWRRCGPVLADEWGGFWGWRVPARNALRRLGKAAWLATDWRGQEAMMRVATPIAFPRPSSTPQSTPVCRSVQAGRAGMRAAARIVFPRSMPRARQRRAAASPSGRAATYNMRHATFDMRHATFDVRHATFDVRHATFDVRHATFDVRHATQAGVAVCVCGVGG